MTHDVSLDEADELDRRERRRARSAPSREVRFRLTSFEDLNVSAAPAYLVKGLIPRVGLTVVWGPPKCGKTFWAFDLFMHVALGWAYRGHRVIQGTVVYCALEGVTGLAARKEAFRLSFLGKHQGPVPFHVMSTPLSLAADQRAFVADIARQIPNTPPAVIVIDTLNRSIAGSESDDRDMSAYIRAADDLKNAFGCSVVVIHHSGLDASRPRGHTSLPGAVDAQISVKRDAANQIIATVGLFKDGPEGEVITSSLRVVEVGTDAEGETITSCIIEQVDGPGQPAKASSPMPKGAKIALNALHEAINDVGKPSASDHIPAAAKVVTLEQWRSYAYRMGVTDSNEADARRKAFARAHETLVARERVGRWDDLVWATSS